MPEFNDDLNLKGIFKNDAKKSFGMNKKIKDVGTPNVNDPSSAYLGPKLWDNTINIMTKPKVEKKVEKTSIAIIRPTTASPLVEVKEEKSFLYAEAEREKEERRQKMEEDFSPEDLALATVPGYDFDPKERAFLMDELRPQPIIRKRKMVAVPEEHKDEKYWEKRL